MARRKQTFQKRFHSREYILYFIKKRPHMISSRNSTSMLSIVGEDLSGYGIDPYP
jgi:hypothetical protein